MFTLNIGFCMYLVTILLLYMLSVVQTAFSIPIAHVKPTKQVKRVNSITLNKETEYILIRVSDWEKKISKYQPNS